MGLETGWLDKHGLKILSLVYSSLRISTDLWLLGFKCCDLKHFCMTLYFFSKYFRGGKTEEGRGDFSHIKSGKCKKKISVKRGRPYPSHHVIHSLEDLQTIQLVILVKIVDPAHKVYLHM
jgi:hypothetical protein